MAFKLMNLLPPFSFSISKSTTPDLSKSIDTTVEQHNIPRGPGLLELQTILDLFPPVSLMKGPYVAGGAVRRLIKGESIRGGDIDFFFHDYRQFNQFVKCMDNFERLHESQHAKTYLAFGMQVQLICRKYYPSLFELFNDFDFSVCQVATDGKSILARRGSVPDIMNNRLRFADYGTVEKSSVTGRLLKYLGHGFLPEPGMFKTIMETGLNQSSSYQIFHGAPVCNYDGHDTKEDNSVHTSLVSPELLKLFIQDTKVQLND